MIPKISIYVIALLFLSNSLKSNKCSTYKEITVFGRALDTKDCAIVQTDKEGVYYLYKVDRWDEKYYGKKVKVTGKLITKTHKRESIDSVLVQEWVGTRRIIKRPQWSLAE